MKKTNKVQVYLKSLGVDENTPQSELDILKKEYWKKERVLRNKEYRATRKDVRFSLSDLEWLSVEKQAQQLNMTVTEYARKALKAHQDGTFVSPNIESLDTLEKVVRNISTNVNSAVQFMHIMRNYGESDSGLGKLREELNVLFQRLKESVQDRPELYTWLQQDLEQNPERIKQVKSIIEKIENNASR